MAVHDSLLLHITSEKFYVESRDSGVSELLIIDRVSQEIYLQANNAGQIPPTAVTKPIYGIFGIIRLTAVLSLLNPVNRITSKYEEILMKLGMWLYVNKILDEYENLIDRPYLIVITRREKVGEISGHTIWAVRDTEVHSYKRTMLHLTEKQMSVNRTYLAMVENALKFDHYYYSTTYDITHSLQRLQNTSPEFLNLSLLERADPRFTWNSHLLREISQQPELSKYCLPVLHGFISISSCNINNRTFDYILISRRCVYRAGTRFYVRGIDTEGQVANYVETEQILQFEGTKCSLVQTRGSIPVYWSQRPNLKYKPKIVINTSSHLEVFQRHVDDQVFNYGEQVVVNLVNSSGSEGMLEKALSQSITNLQSQKLRYEYFDFHHECRKMRWDRLSILTDRLSEDRKRFGYFMVQRDGTVSMYQNGVFRTNCIDCLDRTNVVQGLIAKDVLQQQLVRLGILESTQKVDEHRAFKNLFNNVWADNADCLSKQYAGTGALKTDFTRQGKRTNIGLLMDGWNSLIRYFKNNFADGFRQDSIDLMLGNYVVEENEGIGHPSPLQAERDWKFYAIPVIFVIAMAMCIISVLIPDEDVTEQFMYVLFWGSASMIALATMYVYGSAFVDKPKLVHNE